MTMGAADRNELPFTEKNSMVPMHLLSEHEKLCMSTAPSVVARAPSSFFDLKYMASRSFWLGPFCLERLAGTETLAVAEQYTYNVSNSAFGMHSVF